MFRTAVIGDIHGNIAALKAVLEDLKNLKVDNILFSGDVFGRGPDSEICSKMIMDMNIQGVRGNHEDLLILVKDKKHPKEWEKGKSFISAFWMTERISNETFEWAKNLPFNLESNGIFLTHGRTDSNRAFPKPWDKPEKFENLFTETECKIYVCGHTHKMSVIKLKSGNTIVNSGSVGMPFNGDKRAQYVIIEQDQGNVNVYPRFVNYPISQTVKRYVETGFLQDNDFYSFLLLEDILFARPHIGSFYSFCEKRNLEPSKIHLKEFFRVHVKEGQEGDMFQKMNMGHK